MEKDPIQQLIKEFAAKLTELINERAQGAGAARGGRGGRGRAAAASSAKEPSPGRQLQGQYIGRLRKLRGTKRAQVQRVARDKGVAAAVKLADKLLG